MRVTNNMMLRNTTSNINNNKYSVNSLNNQMSSQKKISRPSEDPVVAIRALRLRSNLSEINQYYEKNIPDADAWLNVTETALENMKTILSDIRTQCTYGASDQLKAEDRKTILTQLESLRKQIYSEGNSDHAGRTVFTGYRTNCKLTFMEDESNTEYNIQQKFSYEDMAIFVRLSRLTWCVAGSSVWATKSRSCAMSPISTTRFSIRLRPPVSSGGSARTFTSVNSLRLTTRWVLSRLRMSRVRPAT